MVNKNFISSTQSDGNEIGPCYQYTVPATISKRNSNKSLPYSWRIELLEFMGNIRPWKTLYSIYKSLGPDNNGIINSDKMP